MCECVEYAKSKESQSKWPRPTSMRSVEFRLLIRWGFRWPLFVTLHWTVPSNHIQANSSPLYGWTTIAASPGDAQYLPETKLKFVAHSFLWSNCFHVYFSHKWRLLSETVLVASKFKIFDRDIVRIINKNTLGIFIDFVYTKTNIIWHQGVWKKLLNKPSYT